jgi:CRISPR-associated protein Cmr4
MYKHCNLMFMICESPLHAGSGSDLDFIDNPIQRERHTGYPKIESSSLKGALRERFSEIIGRRTNGIETAFGPEDPSAGSERQGSLGFSDARLLLFPVKSMKGVFAWVTCPAVLERFIQDMRKVDSQQAFDILPHLPLNEGEAFVFSEELTMQDMKGNDRIILEDFDFEARLDAELKIGDLTLQKWLANQLFPAAIYEYWHGELTDRLVIVSNDDFTDFVELTTEVITRNKIDPSTGTVQKGHLFSEEYLPADAVLYSLVMSHAEFHKRGNGKEAHEIMDFFINSLTQKLKNAFQAGGNATIGKGLLRTVLINQTAPNTPATQQVAASAV